MNADSVKVSFPARCAASVVCGEHLVSQVYPASVPVEVFIDDAIDLLSDDLRRRGAPGLDTEVTYEFNRANGTRLDVTKSLDELGIEDGATLILAQASDGAAFVPHYESLSTGLARVGKDLFGPVTPGVAVRTGLAILAMAVLTVLGLAIYLRMQIESYGSTLVTGMLGVVLLGLAAAVLRCWPHRTDLFRGFAWLGIPAIAVALVMVGPGDLAAAHVFTGLIAVVVMAGAVAAVSGENTATAATLITLCVIAGSVCGIRMFVTAPAHQLGIGVLLGLLLTVTIAPSVALRAARLRPPHFGSITGRDLFRRGDGLPVDTVSPVTDIDMSTDDGSLSESTVSGSTEPGSTPSGVDIAAAAKRANAVLTGMCAATSAALPVAVWFALAPGSSHISASAVLSGLFVVIFISRARTFADHRQAVALVMGAGAGMCAMMLRYVLLGPPVSVSSLAICAAVLGCFSAAGLFAALVVPETRYTPMVRMLAEWCELVAIIAAFPLAAWISGLFAWVRMR